MNKRGFTLVEIIVSTAIFTSVVTIAIGALTSLNKTSREARAVRIILDNANSAVDSMSRTIRMGIRFDGGCTADCACGGRDVNMQADSSMIDFNSPQTTGNRCIRFYGPTTLSTTTLKEIKYKYDSTTKSVMRSQDGSAFEPMTAPEVEVSDMRFYINGTTLDSDQPVITMLMTGLARASRNTREFTVQTTITPRTPNLTIVKP